MTEGRVDELNIEELIGMVDRVAIIVEEIVDSGKRAVLESGVELS